MATNFRPNKDQILQARNRCETYKKTVYLWERKNGTVTMTYKEPNPSSVKRNVLTFEPAKQ